jgi:hypothetical protein
MYWTFDVFRQGGHAVCKLLGVRGRQWCIISMQTETSARSAQAIEAVRLIDGREHNKGSSPFTINVIGINVGIVVVLGVPPPLIIHAATVVIVVVGITRGSLSS